MKFVKYLAFSTLLLTLGACSNEDTSVKEIEKEIVIENNEEEMAYKDVVNKEASNFKLSAFNEYNEYWNVSYKNNYEDFIIKTNKGSYYLTEEGSNVGSISIGDTQSKVREVNGNPISSIEKGNGLYDITSQESDTYEIEGNYVTYFYDLHENNKVRSILVIPTTLEKKKEGFYGLVSESLAIGYEDLMVELINETRTNFGLPALKYDKKVNITARKHSKDMIENNFFSHDGSDGSSAMTRMVDDGIEGVLYGENLAFGQYNAIYAHEGLMNSLGHRENILNKDFTHVGVGVEFNNEGVPYFTINFYK